MNFSLLLKELREAITFRSLGSWFQRLLPLYFTDLLGAYRLAAPWAIACCSDK